MTAITNSTFSTIGRSFYCVTSDLRTSMYDKVSSPEVGSRLGHVISHLYMHCIPSHLWRDTGILRAAKWNRISPFGSPLSIKASMRRAISFGIILGKQYLFFKKIFGSISQGKSDLIFNERQLQF